MTALLAAAAGIECRSCGATEAPFNVEAFPDVCDFCWGAFQRVGKHRWKSPPSNDPLDVQFNRWLSRHVYKDLRRLQLHGVAGRCEAVPNIIGWVYQTGHQCGNMAVGLRDNRKVCPSHLRALNVVFVRSADTSLYDRLTALLTDLASIDPVLRTCLEQAVAASGPHPPEQFGFTNPAQEAFYGTADPIGCGQIVLPDGDAP